MFDYKGTMQLLYISETRKKSVVMTYLTYLISTLKSIFFSSFASPHECSCEKFCEHSLEMLSERSYGRFQERFLQIFSEYYCGRFSQYSFWTFLERSENIASNVKNPGHFLNSRNVPWTFQWNLPNIP